MKAKLRMDVIKGDKTIKQGESVEVSYWADIGLRLFKVVYTEVFMNEKNEEETKTTLFYLNSDEYKIVLEEINE